MTPDSWNYLPQSDLDEIEFRAKFKTLFDGYRKIFDQSLSKSNDLGDLLRFLPGVVVQKRMSMQGMVDLYRIKPDLLERLIKSTIEPLKSFPLSDYTLDDYLSGFLQDRDRSQLNYCDPMLQHIYICRHFFSFLDRSNTSDIQSWVFRLIWNSRFLSFHILAHISAMSSHTFIFTSMTIYVQPPRIFFLDRISPMITLLSKFSMIWKLRHIMIMLMKIPQFTSTGWRNVLLRLFWDGQICWICVWRWLRPMYRGFTFLTQLPRVWPFLFPTLIWWNECVIWQTKFIGKYYA